VYFFFPIAPYFAHHFPPVPPAPQGRPPPPKANAARGIISAARLRGQSGELRPTVICCEVAAKNQYNKLLGNVRITVRGFRIVITRMV
jgi:hypothetical protein